ncbi:MAG: carboxypeptidase-like regulatory domain-containing protein [Myxococcota bacterium]
MKIRTPIAITAALALALAWYVAPRPSEALKGSERTAQMPVRAGLAMTDGPRSIRPLVIGRRRGAAAGRRVLERPSEVEALVETGFLSGHVVDDQGEPIKHAIVHLHGPEGTLAHRTGDDGTFRIAVPRGNWTAEAGWFDGQDEWRSKPSTAAVSGGENVFVPFEILMGGAAHGVHSELKEALGVGWEVAADDGPLRAGDVLVEVDGLLLADLQPASVKAALRSHPGETIPAVVLRRADDGDYEEVPVVLDAR